jgi:hypothetical protein
VNELAHAIVGLLDDPVHARALGDNLRNEARLHRNWDSTAVLVSEVCAKAIDDTSKNHPRR